MSVAERRTTHWSGSKNSVAIKELTTIELREASWTAAALCRFGNRTGRRNAVPTGRDCSPKPSGTFCPPFKSSHSFNRSALAGAFQAPEPRRISSFVAERRLKICTKVQRSLRDGLPLRLPIRAMNRTATHHSLLRELQPSTHQNAFYKPTWLSAHRSGAAHS
jgi:hypothetical protein